MNDPSDPIVSTQTGARDYPHGLVDRDGIFLLTTPAGPFFLDYDQVQLMLETAPGFDSYAVELEILDGGYVAGFKVQLFGDTLVRTAAAKDRT